MLAKNLHGGMSKLRGTSKRWPQPQPEYASYNNSPSASFANF